MANFYQRIKNVFTDNLVDVKDLWDPSEIQDATILVNRINQLHEADVEKRLGEQTADYSEDLAAVREVNTELSSECEFLRSEVDRLTPKLTVSDEAQKLSAEISQAIAELTEAKAGVDEDSYITRGEYREAINNLQALKGVVDRGWIELDLRADICYEQDETGIAQEKDMYETAISSAQQYIDRAIALGHKVLVTEFNDNGQRWEFLDRWEEQQIAEHEKKQESAGISAGCGW